MKMNGNSGGVGTCSAKATYLKISILFLLCMVIYVYLYSSITVQTFAIGEVMRGTIHDIQRWRDKMEGWVQMLGGVKSETTNLSAINSYEIHENEIFRNKASLSKNGINSFTRNYTINQRNATQVVFKSGFESENVSLTSINKKLKITKADTTITQMEIEPELLLTLFTSWPSRAEKYTCHNNTIRNWAHLKPLVKPIIFTNEFLLAEEANEKGWDVLPVRRAGKGIPILKYMYIEAKERYSSPFYAFANGDILFTDSILQTLKKVINSTILPKDKPIMIVGRRINVQYVTSEEASSWKNISKAAQSRGSLFTVWAEDYFITSADYPWSSIPEVVIGRRAYDNWLVSNAVKQKHVTIDATETLLALHQTTKGGNNEGHKAANAEYNHKLLSRLYKKLQYAAGLTSCAQYYTRYNSEGQPEVLKRRKTC